MFISVCSCGQGVVDDDRDKLAAKVSAHLRGEFFPPAMTPAGHAAWIGTADAKISVDVKTEALGDQDA